MFRNYIKAVYDGFRNHLPRKNGVYYNVPVRDQRLLDASDHDPNRKEVFLDHLRRESSQGDRVLVFGGGRGVAAVVAARRILPTGEVVVYEAAKEQVAKTRSTVRFNRVDEYVTVEHAIVGADVDIWGDHRDATQLRPDTLPESQVWAVDIEGGEVGLLRQALEDDTAWPRIVIIESHPQNGVSSKNITRLLSKSEVFDSVETYDKGSSTATGGDIVVAKRSPEKN
jgi:hypothetical protein